jgi:hypothetical protein
MAEIKSKGLFDHIKAITAEQDPNYFDTLTDADIKTFSNYMIHRFLSMNPDWLDLLFELQPYTEILKPKELYLTYIGILPKGKQYLRYIKGKKNKNSYEDFLIDLIVKYYECSEAQANEYCEILYSTKQGKLHIREICEKYGTDPKQIKKLKV